MCKLVSWTVDRWLLLLPSVCMSAGCSYTFSLHRYPQRGAANVKSLSEAKKRITVTLFLYFPPKTGTTTTTATKSGKDQNANICSEMERNKRCDAAEDGLCSAGPIT